jgi:hypothetical protein
MRTIYSMIERIKNKMFKFLKNLFRRRYKKGKCIKFSNKDDLGECTLNVNGLGKREIKKVDKAVEDLGMKEYFSMSFSEFVNQNKTK